MDFLYTIYIVDGNQSETWTESSILYSIPAIYIAVIDFRRHNSKSEPTSEPRKQHNIKLITLLCASIEAYIIYVCICILSLILRWERYYIYIYASCTMRCLNMHMWSVLSILSELCIFGWFGGFVGGSPRIVLGGWADAGGEVQIVENLKLVKLRAQIDNVGAVSHAI